MGGGGGMAVYVLDGDAIGFGEPLGYKGDEAALVALPSMGNGCHIGTVGLEDDAVEGDNSGEDFRQMAFLEGEDTTDAKDELREL